MIQVVEDFFPTGLTGPLTRWIVTPMTFKTTTTKAKAVQGSISMLRSGKGKNRRSSK